MKMEKSMFRLAWTSSSFLRQEYGPSTCTVRSTHSYQHPPLASKIRKCEMIQLPISSVCKLPLTSCISPTLATTAIPAGLSDFQWRSPFFILFCKMSNARNRARLRKNKIPLTPPQLFPSLPVWQQWGGWWHSCQHQQPAVTRALTPAVARAVTAASPHWPPFWRQPCIQRVPGKAVLRFYGGWIAGLRTKTVSSISPAGSLSSFRKKCEENTFYGRYLSLPSTT